ncbi:hypothetical protein ACQKWADRAFT_163059 [Trichoderma austrokoningii]
MGSQRDIFLERTRIANQATDGNISTSPSDSSFSDFYFYDSNDEINNGGAQSGLSTARRDQQEPSSSLEANEELPSEPSNMVKPHTCDRCPMSFEKRYDLNRHIKRHDKPEKCPRCSYAAPYPKDLTRHIWVRHSKWAEETNFPSIKAKCKICDTELQRPDYIKRHIEEVHGGKKRKRGPKG